MSIKNSLNNKILRKTCYVKLEKEVNEPIDT